MSNPTPMSPERYAELRTLAKEYRAYAHHAFAERLLMGLQDALDEIARLKAERETNQS